MKTIYYKLLFLMMLLPFAAFSQNTVEGIVLDSKTSKPIAGVNVVIKGGSSVSTQDNGAFKLVKVNKGDKITFSYIGYQNQVIEYTGQKALTVMLAETSNTLEAVTVQVGYGSVKKKDVTGSVAVVGTKDFNKGAITSVDGLLNGRAAGVVVTSSGTPGNGANIRIRGGSSLSASNDPLIVVDGLPISGGLNSINPNDIETFSILKDASSTAIYGNRGANGVILITTKNGSKRLQVNVNTFTTLNTLQKQIDVLDANEFRNLINQYAPTRAGLLGNSNTNWQKEIFKNSYTSELNVQLLGNLFNKIPSRLSIGNTDNHGILLTSNYKRLTGSLSMNPSFFDNHLKVNLAANYSYTYTRMADEGAIGSAISYDPTQSVYDASSPYAGYTEWLSSGTNYPTGAANPVSLLLEKRNLRNQQRFFGNANIEYKLHFFPDLKAIVNAGYETVVGDESYNSNPNSRAGFQQFTGLGTGSPIQYNLPLGYYETKWDLYDNRNLNLILNYTKKIKDFNVDFMGAHEYNITQSSNFATGNLNRYPYLDASQINAIRDRYTDPGNKLESWFGRLNLGFKEKYLLTVNFRRDGSSRMSPVNKFENFMGYAFAWKINEEGFLKNSKTISEMKLRLSYGENGNQSISSAYDWFKRYTTSTSAFYQFGNEYIPVSKPVGYNENLKWERVAKYNIGLDFGFFNNKLKGSIDAYFAKTTDMLSYVNEGALQNLRVQGWRNVGNMESKGLEFLLNYNAVKSEKLDLSFNYTFNYNALEITNLFSNNLDVGQVDLQGYAQRLSIGYSPYTFYVYQQVYDQNGKPIDGVYVDRNKDGIINSNDKYMYKKPQAPVTMGFMTNATFCKNWDFSMGWRASIGNYVYDQVNADRAIVASIADPVNSNIVNNTTPDFYNTNFLNTNKESDYYVKNASFLKLDNVTLGYKFNDIFKGVKSFRVYTGVTNVFFITKYKNLDPEVFNNGIDNTIYPRARMYMLGANISF